jgi:hypothetical protein
MIEKYENQPLKQAASLLVEDQITFSVLVSVLTYPCQRIITDNKDFIICYTNSPYPVWVWTKTGSPKEVFDNVRDILNKEFNDENHFYFNMKYEFLNYLINSDNANGWFVSTNMLTYECPMPIEPKKVQGLLHTATMDDYDIIRKLVWGVFAETSEKKISDEECGAITKMRINSGNLLLWKNKSERIVATCGIEYGVVFGKITLVYTVPEERRKGYAARIVYEATCKIAERGYKPILYTDGDYCASNECYKGIGYIERGRLCSVSKH